jgi:hypothetical protein
VFAVKKIFAPQNETRHSIHREKQNFAPSAREDSYRMTVEEVLQTNPQRVYPLGPPEGLRFSAYLKIRSNYNSAASRNKPRLSRG